MVYAWSQTPRSIGSKKTCSTWPSDSSLSSRNRGRNILETGGKSNCVKGRCCLSRHWGEPFGFQVQACAEVWHVLRGELLKRRPVASRSGRADGHRTEPTPPAVSWSVVFLCLNELLNNLFPGLWFVFFIFLLFSPTDATRALPDFVDLDLGQSNTENISPDDVKALQSLYREHCEVRGIHSLHVLCKVATATWKRAISYCGQVHL